MMVDLRLAHTYIPACVAILKTSILIITVSNAHGDDYRTPAILMLLCVPLYMDRIFTTESLLDCNAMLCTIHASYILNALRHILGRGLFLSAGVKQHPISSTPPPVTSSRLLLSTYHVLDWREVSGATIENSTVAATIIDASVILLVGLSLALLVDQPLCKPRSQSGVVVHSKWGTVTAFSVLLGTYLQTPLYEEVSRCNDACYATYIK